MTPPRKQRTWSAALLVGLVLALVPPCCGGCTSAEPAAPSCHGGEGLELVPGDDCCLSHSQRVGEIHEIYSPPQPVLLPDSVIAAGSESVLSLPTGSAHELARSGGVPLFTLLCTLLS